MPGRNGTGPAGEGSMTGGGRGTCVTTDPSVLSRFAVLGRGRGGVGRGLGLGFGFGARRGMGGAQGRGTGLGRRWSR